jgi:hypothetical protein
MGGHPWFYFVEYQPDIEKALHELREREFEAGRYNPVVRFPQFPVTADSLAPGAQHRSIDEALAAADADGTRSILDMERISETPDHCAVTALSKERLMAIFRTEKPSHEMIESDCDLFDSIRRGMGIYLIVYKHERPDEIFFAGYSFD